VKSGGKYLEKNIRSTFRLLLMNCSLYEIVKYLFPAGNRLPG
jgi:hypothetical protein